MNEEDDLRIIELESKVMFQEKTILELSDMVAEQWKTMDILQKKLQFLESKVTTIEQDVPTQGEERLPPHY